MKDLLKFVSLPRSEKMTVLKAFFMVLRVRVCLWFFPSYSVKNRLLAANGEKVKGRAADWAAVERTVASVERCSQYIPRATCLTKALSVFLLLQNMGQASNVRIGVEKDQHGRFRAHAWVEVEERIVIGKVPLLDRFTVLQTSTLIT